MHDALTVNQHLILAAADLPQPFHETVLVLAAWKACPVLLGMTGRPWEFPSDNKVRAAMSGERGLVRRGWLLKTGKLQYTLSEKGKQEVERIKNGSPAEPKRRPLGVAHVSKPVGARLSAMFLTRAFRRWQESMRNEITWNDAREFWMLGEFIRGDRLADALDDTLAVIVGTLKAVAGGEVHLKDGRVVSAKCLGTLEDLHNWLVGRFAGELQRQREGRFRKLAPIW